MKRIVIITIMLTLCASMVAAQGITGKGIKVGLNLANVYGDDADMEGADKKMRIGFAVGGFLTYSINEMFAVQPELLYSMQGVKYEPSEGDIDGELIMKYDYIQIPILAKVNFPMEGKVKPNIFLGPALGINLSAKYEYTDDLGDAMEAMGMDKEGDIENVKSTAFGLVFGAGIDYGIGNGKLTFDARYNLGLTTVDDSDDDLDIKDSTISIMLGYSF